MSLTYKSKEISKALLKKGFAEKPGDHLYYILYIDGKKTIIKTKVSHSVDEYGIELLKKIWHQLKLSKKGLQALLDCPMSYEDYIANLEDNGHFGDN